ncbi:MAG: hypothetical protein L3J24_04375 [Xanthomonadales bacterium]|nr:hypothetical protein [Xanthomonadales bacterium]
MTSDILDIAQISQRLNKAGFSPVSVGEEVVLQPFDACGCLVVFEGENSRENTQ